jgi:LAO/AO transport system kinase
VDIARLAHTTLVIEAPGMGDEIQAFKAGILEIADILVINKADRPGVESTQLALAEMLEMGYPRRRVGHAGIARAGDELWVPPVVKTIATTSTGAQDLVQAIQAHRAFLERTGEWQRRQYDRLADELDRLITSSLVSAWRARLPEELYESTLAQLCERKISPYTALEQLKIKPSGSI